MLPAYLDLLGFGSYLGYLLTTTLIGTALGMVLVIFWADRFGRRRTLLIFGFLMALAGLLFASSPLLPVMFLAAFIGNIGVTGTETGSFLSLEQAILPLTCPAGRRTDLFSLYNLVGYGGAAIGALFAGAPLLLGLEELLSYRILFTVFLTLGVVVVLGYLFLSSRIELARSEVPLRPLSPKSKPIVWRLSGLFALDAFAGGLVIQSILSAWFLAEYGAKPSLTGPIFFFASIITALSILAASRIASRIGLINTMVFTHLPSNILLASIPLAPNLELATLLLFARQSISQMDVPTRQSYIMAVVPAEDRTATASITNLSRSLAQAVGPSLADSLLIAGFLSAPFLFGGGLKIVYDVALYFSFRRVKPPEEATPEP